MIHWLVQDDGAHPDLAHGNAPAGLFSAGEKAQWAALRTGKRCHDWLLGRWTAKRLLQAVTYQRSSVIFPLAEITIFNDPDGVPVAVVPGHPALSLSISHSSAYGFCAVIERDQWPIGADIEQVEPHTNAFVADYFVAEEIAGLRDVPAEARDTLITAIWSAKEAALKALHVGLSVDTRAVICTLGAHSGQPQAWTPLDIRCDSARLNRPATNLAGWWRTSGDYVLTLVAKVCDSSRSATSGGTPDPYPPHEA